MGIIEIGIGNPKSIHAAMESIGVTTHSIYAPDKVEEFEKIILPGIGNFGAFMKLLDKKGFSGSLLQFIKQKERRILGLCVGAQAMLDSSEEDGSCNGLGIIQGINRRLSHKESKFIPRTGWDIRILNLESRQTIHPWLQTLIDGKNRFYFSHSYKFDIKNPDNIVSQSKSEPQIPSIFILDNILGAQFHPEKSLNPGLKFLEYFAKEF